MVLLPCRFTSQNRRSCGVSVDLLLIGKRREASQRMEEARTQQAPVKKTSGPVLLDDVEEIIAKMVKEQTKDLKKVRKQFDKEKREFEDQKSKLTKALNLKKVQRKLPTYYHCSATPSPPKIYHNN